MNPVKIMVNNFRKRLIKLRFELDTLITIQLFTELLGFSPHFSISIYSQTSEAQTGIFEHYRKFKQESWSRQKMLLIQRVRLRKSCTP